MESSCPAARPDPVSRPPISLSGLGTSWRISGLEVVAGFLLVALSVPLGVGPPVRAQSTGGGFHGYGWGTRPEAIPLVEGGASPDRRIEGRFGYASFLRLLGMPTRAVFYFDSAEAGLVGGKYLSQPQGLSCLAQFRTLRLLVSSDVGSARLALRKGTGAEEPDFRKGCRRFRKSSSPAPWEAVYIDRTSGDTVALVRLFRRKGEPRLMACYRLGSDCRWPEDVSIQEPPRLGPAGRDTAGSQPE